VKNAGVEFSFPDISDLNHLVENWRAARKRAYVVLSNPHSVMMCRRDSDMRDATLGADLRLADGVGVVLGGRLLGLNNLNRVTGPHLMLELCDKGRAAGLRHFFYGGAEGVAQQLASRLSEKFPGLNVAGTLCPPFRELSEVEQRKNIDHINAAGADVVWVGLGAPKQEKWMADHVGRIHATALIGVGAAFDFHSGNIPWAPQWIRSIGCEWAYRLALEPRRMWRRNLDSPLFLVCVALQAAAAMAAGLRLQLKAAADWVVAPDDTFGGNGGAGASTRRPSSRRRTSRLSAQSISSGALEGPVAEFRRAGIAMAELAAS
jgi:N-acetylglucosaminyldiphosphoundecaprenol N-acetyl-beta-D-mannosaminyltransferase